MPDSLLHVASGRFGGLCPSHLLSAFSMESCFFVFFFAFVTQTGLMFPPSSSSPPWGLALGVWQGRTLVCVEVHRMGLTDHHWLVSISQNFQDSKNPASCFLTWVSGKMQHGTISLAFPPLLTPACQLHHCIREYCNSFVSPEEQSGATSFPDVYPPSPGTLWEGAVTPGA